MQEDKNSNTNKNCVCEAATVQCCRTMHCPSSRATVRTKPSSPRTPCARVTLSGHSQRGILIPHHRGYLALAVQCSLPFPLPMDRRGLVRASAGGGARRKRGTLAGLPIDPITLRTIIHNKLERQTASCADTRMDGCAPTHANMSNTFITPPPPSAATNTTRVHHLTHAEEPELREHLRGGHVFVLWGHTHRFVYTCTDDLRVRTNKG